MSTKTFAIKFPGVDSATAGKFAKELRDYILDNASPESETKVALRRDDPESQDIGSVIEVVLGIATSEVGHAVISHAAVLSVVEGIRLWSEFRKVPIRIEAGGKIIAVDHVKKELAEEIVKGLQSHD